MITSIRAVPIACHVTHEVKEAVRAEAKAAGLSMSEYVYVALRQKLERDGVDLKQYETDDAI